MRRTLIEFEAWSVCETDDGEDRNTEVYAEHFRDCTHPYEDDDGTKAGWSWEYDDWPDDNGKDACWECGVEVPEEVVALVRLHNWGRNRRDRG